MFGSYLLNELAAATFVQFATALVYIRRRPVVRTSPLNLSTPAALPCFQTFCGRINRPFFKVMKSGGALKPIKPFLKITDRAIDPIRHSHVDTAFVV
ncbi:MAG TPA: hypothetical protein VHY91_09590 [Pirellulales bacterium]|jgi:hypothetical protein|nr:hypothetical protein [Pirellulales bacterium]